ncbi:MAG TPA: 2-(1,2-epoxy-1,2-dihydrophenyl)acetyl-CoA isomerase [Flavobacteriales bacterium]|nr:2-(1,2-epoxy-1,2-dihydrophenyl)acetyl-CoA isomerase [Flavobacteriales bacterium]
MDYKLIKFDISNAVAKITLNRPDVLNSFNKAMSAEVQDALDQCAGDNAVRAVLLTGEGRGFCAGQDLEEAMSPDTKIEDIVRTTYNPMVLKIRELEKPVICAVNGVAAGAGANIAFGCDLTLAASSAKFIQSFIKIGLIPDSGGTHILPRLVGMQRAAAMTMLGDKLTAEEAQHLGLIYRVVVDEQLMEEATALAEKLAQMPTVGLGLTKRGLNNGLKVDLATQLEFEAGIQAEAASSEDYKEGVNAFLEKRAPNYTGK